MKKNWIIVTVFCASAAFAQTAAQTNSAARTTAAKKKKKAAPAKAAASNVIPPPLTIPKEAVLDPADGNYHYTDKNGKKWVYRQGPMGASRWEDKGAPSGQTAEHRFSHDPNLKAVDQGDTVKFTRTTPFGPQTWTKKKSALTDDERSMLGGQAVQANAGEKAQN